jgi:hypothetical protein
MTYHIDFSSVAKAEADAAFLILSQFTTGERAQTWYQGLISVYGYITSSQQYLTKNWVFTPSPAIDRENNQGLYTNCFT